MVTSKQNKIINATTYLCSHAGTFVSNTLVWNRQNFSPSEMFQLLLHVLRPSDKLSCRSAFTDDCIAFPFSFLVPFTASVSPSSVFSVVRSTLVSMSRNRFINFLPAELIGIATSQTHHVPVVSSPPQVTKMCGSNFPRTKPTTSRIAPVWMTSWLCWNTPKCSSKPLRRCTGSRVVKRPPLCYLGDVTNQHSYRSISYLCTPEGPCGVSALALHWWPPTL